MIGTAIVCLKTGEEVVCSDVSNLSSVYALQAKGKAKDAIRELMLEHGLDIPYMDQPEITWYGRDARELVGLINSN